MKVFALLVYLAAVFTFVAVFFHVCRPRSAPRYFAVTAAGVFTLLVGSMAGVGMWSRENLIDRGEPGPPDLMP